MASDFLMHLFWIFYFRFAARLPIFFLNHVLCSFDISFFEHEICSKHIQPNKCDWQ